MYKIDNAIHFNHRCGSVDVDYELIFAWVDPPAPQQLAQMVQETIEENGGLVAEDGTTFTVDETSIVFEGTHSLFSAHERTVL